MNVDLRKLEEFDQMAVSGANTASSRLSGLTGIDSRVDWARLNVFSATDIRDQFQHEDTLAITVSLTGDLDGEAVCLFDRAGAKMLAEAFMPMLPDDGYTSKHEDAVGEICNVMVSGYIDGWANQQDRSIVMSAPTVVSSACPDDDGKAGELAVADEATHVISQRSSMTTDGGEVEFQLSLLLTEPSSESLFGADDATAIDNELLGTLTTAIEEGTTAIRDQLQAVTGLGVDTDLATLDLVPTERLSETVSDEHGVGAVVELEDCNGYLLVLFDPESARTVAQQLDTDPATADAEHCERAAETVGTAVARSVTNHLGTTVEPSPPKAVDDMRSSILNDAAINLDPDERFAITFTATLTAPETGLTCDIYTLISPAQLPAQWSQ